ncbi:sensor domain-containing diguanylate cyclase [Thermomonas sp. HDW16]|uniref:sensor domain-containing diguanylate cyclase n=1 Tax=Thermomonas sp. HDW16 TaxID=2714945 RepID=UPI001409B45E|nr:sensor domain-containing diguanylate cyclase [Thermomonas sp. HDW16]QIL20809.1 sensor domain-containing diguanylate cyclase [Thermomonas sp. HDW16]
MKDETTTRRDFIARLSDSISDADSLETLVRPLLEMLEAVTGLESTYMTSIDEDAGLQRILYARNTRDLQIPEGLTATWQDTLCKRALEQERVYVDDVPAVWGDSDAARALGIATYASTPIHGQDGRLYGTLCAASSARKPMTVDAERVLRMFSLLIGQQVERERLLQELRQANRALALSALTDPATGLPNRRALMSELARRLARSERNHNALLVAFIDLDGFKAINDQHGHEAGDRMLVLVGHALVHAARAGDYCARLGGDEFVVLASVPPEEGEAALAALQKRLHDATRGRFELSEGTAIDYAGPSIGTILAPADQHDVDAVLALADAAMYSIKRLRKIDRPG